MNQPATQTPPRRVTTTPAPVKFVWLEDGTPVADACVFLRKPDKTLWGFGEKHRCMTNAQGVLHTGKVQSDGKTKIGVPLPLQKNQAYQFFVDAHDYNTLPPDVEGWERTQRMFIPKNAGATFEVKVRDVMDKSSPKKNYRCKVCGKSRCRLKAKGPDLELPGFPFFCQYRTSGKGGGPWAKAGYSTHRWGKFAAVGCLVTSHTVVASQYYYQNCTWQPDPTAMTEHLKLLRTQINEQLIAEGVYPKRTKANNKKRYKIVLEKLGHRWWQSWSKHLRDPKTVLKPGKTAPDFEIQLRILNKAGPPPPPSKRDWRVEAWRYHDPDDQHLLLDKIDELLDQGIPSLVYVVHPKTNKDGAARHWLVVYGRKNNAFLCRDSGYNQTVLHRYYKAITGIRWLEKV